MEIKLIAVKRDHVTYGPYTVDELTQHIANGNVLADDLGQVEGTTSWNSVGQLLERDSGLSNERKENVSQEQPEQLLTEQPQHSSAEPSHIADAAASSANVEEPIRTVDNSIVAVVIFILVMVFVVVAVMNSKSSQEKDDYQIADVLEMKPKKIGTELDRLNGLRTSQMEQTYQSEVIKAQRIEGTTRSINNLLLGILQNPEKCPPRFTMADVSTWSKAETGKLIVASSHVEELQRKEDIARIDESRKRDEQRLAVEKGEAIQRMEKERSEAENQRRAMQDPVRYSGAIGRCQMLAHMPRGGYCLSVYFSCVARELGDGVQIPIPREPGYANAYSPC